MNKGTGYPSIDKPWLQYYKEGAFEAAQNVPKSKTVWDVLEEKLIEHKEIPALEYFGRSFSSNEFRELVYTWAKSFRTLGVKENEVVPIYGPNVPDICAMGLALNMIGATAYFLKLAISPAALAEETAESKIAVVYSDMWQNVANEFSKDRFETVIFYNVTDSMPFPKKEIISLLNTLKKRTKNLPVGEKYLSASKARKCGKNYVGELRVEFVSKRKAFITSSSGTTGGVVKGTVATNESTIAQLLMCTNSEFQYHKGGRCLNNLPPTASTSLNALFFLPIYCGTTVIVDPRISPDDFYNQILNLKPNISITTGTMWEMFFNRISNEIAAGKNFDFSHSTGWVVGGEGTDPRKMNKWDEIMRKCNAPFGMCSGYGSSELFSSVSSDTHRAVGFDDRSKGVIAVGVPLAGLVCGIFDENGKELPYNQRGELWVNSHSAMKEYYNKPELTSQTIIDGWVHIGDLAEIDPNGFLYIWGRVKDKYILKDGGYIYLFDVADKIKENPAFIDASVLPAPNNQGQHSLVAHVVWENDVTEEEKINIIIDTNKKLKEYLPAGVNVIGFYDHANMLPYSPTTLKKDKAALSRQMSGFYFIENGMKKELSFMDNK